MSLEAIGVPPVAVEYHCRVAFETGMAIKSETVDITENVCGDGAIGGGGGPCTTKRPVKYVDPPRPAS